MSEVNLDAKIRNARAGDAKTERVRRARVVKGWAFRDLPESEVNGIKSYLEGGPVPTGYEKADQEIR